MSDGSTCPLCGETGVGSLPGHLRFRCEVADAGRQRVAEQDGEGLVLEVT